MDTQTASPQEGTGTQGTSDSSAAQVSLQSSAPPQRPLVTPQAQPLHAPHRQLLVSPDTGDAPPRDRKLRVWDTDEEDDDEQQPAAKRHQVNKFSYSIGIPITSDFSVGTSNSPPILRLKDAQMMLMRFVQGFPHIDIDFMQGRSHGDCAPLILCQVRFRPRLGLRNTPLLRRNTLYPVACLTIRFFAGRAGCRKP